MPGLFLSPRGGRASRAYRLSAASIALPRYSLAKNSDVLHILKHDWRALYATLMGFSVRKCKVRGFQGCPDSDGISQKY